MPRHPKLPPFVLLTWLEHYSIEATGTYQRVEQLGRGLDQPLYTAGWLVKSDKTHYYVATTVSFEKGILEFTSVMAVLRRSVLKKVQRTAAQLT